MIFWLYGLRRFVHGGIGGWFFGVKLKVCMPLRMDAGAGF